MKLEKIREQNSSLLHAFFYPQEFSGKASTLSLILIKDLNSSGNVTWDIVKFDKEFKSELRIGLTCKNKSGNRKNLPNRKNSKKSRENVCHYSPIPKHLSAKFSIQKYM